MISTILLWAYIFLLSTVSGHFFFRISGMFKNSKSDAPGIAELSIAGLVFCGVFLAVYSFFEKIGLAANIVIASFCLLYFLTSAGKILFTLKSAIRSFLQFPVRIKILAAIYLLLLLLAAQALPTIADTGLYHVQNIKWISSYKVVPGLGNLQGRFAFNNHSFLLESLFSFSFLRPDFFHLLNSYLLLLLSLTLISLINKYLAADRWKALLYSGLLLLLPVFYLKAASSPTPDIFALVSVWFIFIIYLERICVKPENGFYWVPVLFIAFFTVTVKLSAFPVALIAIVFLAEHKGRFTGKVLKLALPALLVFIPYFIRNYIISGYLVYPFPHLDLFKPDWKIPIDYVKEMSSVISTYAQSGGWEQMPFAQWFPGWFAHLSAGFRLVSCYLVLSPFLLIAILIFSTKTRSLFPGFMKLSAICVAAVIYWFLTAPNFRFIYAFLLFYLMMNLVIIIHFIADRFFPSLNMKMAVNKGSDPVLKPASALVIILSLLFLALINYKGIDKCVLFPTGFKEVKFSSVELNNFNVNIPEDGTYCWNIPIPASVIQRHIGVNDIELRGPDLKYGFGMKIDRTEEMLRLRDYLRH